eukprot:5627649-Prymnesium_polylepis.1
MSAAACIVARSSPHSDADVGWPSARPSSERAVDGALARAAMQVAVNELPMVSARCTIATFEPSTPSSIRATASSTGTAVTAESCATSCCIVYDAARESCTSSTGSSSAIRRRSSSCCGPLHVYGTVASVALSVVADTCAPCSSGDSSGHSVECCWRTVNGFASASPASTRSSSARCASEHHEESGRPSRTKPMTNAGC